jgi:ABC-type transport system involved in multi-copper enzyme maturation permease subunit
MGIFADNPVLEREMRGRLRLRRRGMGKSFVWVPVILAVVIFYFYARGLAGLFAGPRQDAREFWPLLTYGLLALIVLLAPALTATAITTEREQQTWETLASTRLTGSEIILGKWLARQTIPILLILLVCPYLLGCVIRGQMGVLLLPAILAFLLITSFFYGALGLACSYLAKRTVTATATALTCTAFFSLGTYIIASVVMILNGPRDSIVLWLNPFYAFSALEGLLSRDYQVDQNISIVWFYFLVVPTLTTAMLLFMVRRYRQAVRG